MWFLTILALAGALVGVGLLRAADARRVKAAWNGLALQARAQPKVFLSEMIRNAPAPVERYFRFSIAEGTPLYRVVQLDLAGEIGLGSRERPGYMPMRAVQILAGPAGFVWRSRMGSGLLRISGTDGYYEGEGWTRFWLWSLIPIVRAGGGPDFARSAAARGIAEAVLWLPTLLLPRDGVKWEALAEDRARVTVLHRGERFSAELAIAADGRPLSIVMQRWSRENPERQWRLQPFGATVEETKTFGGLRIASRVKAGNHFGTLDYFPFYIASVAGAVYR